jgi:hypothetical protein
MTQIFADEQKQTPERFIASPLLPPSQRVKASLLRGDGCVRVAANFPLNFFKTTISLAFPQIRRGNEVQPFVCLLLPFYFPTEFTFGSSKQRKMRSN